MIAKELLEELYVKQNKKIVDIAKELNISKSQVLDYLYKYKFKKSNIEKVCKNCHKVFNPPRSHPDVKFCCYECSRQSRCVLENKICPNCKKEFKPKTKRDKYCSKHCSDEAKKDKFKNSYVTVCKECRKIFRTVPSNNQRYCSRECFDMARKNGKVKSNRKHGTYEQIYGKERAEKIRQKLKSVKRSDEFKKYVSVVHTGRKRSKETCEKLKQIQLSKEHQLKIYNTKKKNHSFNTSKLEKQIFKLLKEKFKNINKQYKSDLYPFDCDFYIPEIDLYIEIQGHWSHGMNKYRCPFDDTNPDHLGFLEKCKNKNTPFYNKLIEVWTVRDPLKRKIAKENNLNWIEFFTMEEFMTWFEKQ